MLVRDAIKILKNHNNWRRGDEDFEMQDPKTIGKAIDLVVSTMETLIKPNITLDKENNNDSENSFLRVGGDVSGNNFEHTYQNKEATINYLLEKTKEAK